MLQFQLNIDEAKKTVLLDTFDLTINFDFFDQITWESLMVST